MTAVGMSMLIQLRAQLAMQLIIQCYQDVMGLRQSFNFIQQELSYMQVHLCLSPVV